MRRLPLLLVTAAMLAPALTFPPLPVMAQSAATADQRVEAAQRALEKAEKSLQDAEETGGDIRAARRSVANAMKSLRSAESAAGIAPAATAPVNPPPTVQAPAAPAPATPASPDAGPKPYTPPETPTAKSPGAKAPEAKPPEAKAPEAKQTAPAKPAKPPAAQPQEAAPKPAKPVVTRRNGITETRTPRADGGTIVEQRDASGRIIRRVEIAPNGTEAVIIDRTRGAGTPVAPPRIYDPREVPPPPGADLDGGRASEAEIERALRAAPRRGSGGYSINEIQRSERIRQRVAAVDLDTITFPSGSARVPEDQVWKLERIGRAVRRIVERWPDQVFLIEGHTDAVGTRLANRELSARRADSVAGILVRYFGVPPRNLVTEGYGEDYLKVRTDGPSRENRRVTIRNITPLLGR
ncbi:OmpA family protein [Kaistia geumhonensis]|uniref:Outer membrane protein OmpA-like peptidoglycan-associated protein n=1 Tax=Kaistia geumhonensis TaxID=410839 RepID=A0ABU0M1P2_9HYPH|nr:OmpA family protein [Kaistia geumhonensis]MCX5479906.1 OmpA family protein [Kaistia geumhonensis]MDQ0514867.1 outer membrane protein OmpA-like peptidoglycan-associated protein [Kaistia geumhonensis]